MKDYGDRTYRKQFRSDRWCGFVAKYKETDVWIGIDKNSFHREMPEFTEKTIRALRNEVDIYLKQDPQYRLSLIPYNAQEHAPKILKDMSEISHKANVGPMATVAGAFATYVAQELKKQFKIEEIIIENGGDIYADIKQDLDVSVFAGTSPLSEKIGLRIDAKKSPLGICTSSGTVGHSLSFGKADAVMIVCKNATLSDGYATAFANKIQTSDDINPVLKLINEEKNILSALIVKNDKMGVVGQFELKLFN
ncbi:MAG: UPF0280 family protein [Bacteroidales bacterium]|nr:UPF0280 family protein [Bacteroidales bacterium]